MAPSRKTGLQAWSNSKAVYLRECIYTVEILDFVASVTAELTYTNKSATEEVVLFNFPRRFKGTSYLVHNCEATLGIEMVTSSVVKDDEVMEVVGSQPLNQSVITDLDIYRNMLGVLRPHSEAKVLVEFTFQLTRLSHQSMMFVVPVIQTGCDDIDVKANVRMCTPYEVVEVDDVTELHKERSPGPLRVYSWQTTNSQKDTALEFTISLNMHESQKNGLSVVMEDGQEADEENVMHGRLAMLSAWFSPEDFKGRSSGQGEYIFMVDCSASMRGLRMRHARQTLLLFLKSLPVGCYFNVISFGENHTTLFRKSRPYGPDTLKEAAKLQSNMEADMGYTYFAGPLRTALDPDLVSGYPRYVFILTDGIAHDKDLCVPIIKSSAHKARVCAFGIGDLVDKKFIRQIARQGHGVYDFFKYSQMEAKVMTALRQMMDTCVTNVKVDWPEGVKAEMLTDVPSLIYPGHYWVTFARVSRQPTLKKSSVAKTKKLSNSYLTLSYGEDGKTVRNDLAGKLCDASLFKAFPLHHQLASYQLTKAAETNDVDKMLQLCAASGIHHPKFALVTRNAATDTLTGVVRTQTDKPAVLRRPRGGIPKTALKKLAKRGGVARLSSLVYEEMRSCLKEFLERIIADTVTYMENRRKRTAIEEDVDNALRLNGIKLFGFQEPALYKHEVQTTRGRRRFRRVRKIRRSTPLGNPAATASIASVLGVPPTPVRRGSSRRPTASSGSKRTGSLRKSTSSTASARSLGSSGKSTPALSKKPTLIINNTDQVVETLSKRVSNTSKKSTGTPSPSTSQRTASRGASAKRKMSLSASDAGSKRSKPSATKGARSSVSMVSLISLQNFDGTWEMSKALADVLQEDLNVLTSASPIKDVKIWATVLAITYLEINFKEAETEWEMIKDKAVHFVKSSNPDFGGLTLEGLESKAMEYV